MSSPTDSPRTTAVADTGVGLLGRLAHWRRSTPTAVVLDTFGGRHRERITYGGLYARCLRTADALAAAGIGPGTRAVVMTRRPLDLLTTVYALSALGACAVLIDPGLPREALRRCLEEAAPQAFVGEPLAHAARVLRRWAPGVRTLVSTGTGPRPGPWPTIATLARTAPRTSSTVTDDCTALIAYTSGSTGTPKGVVYTNEQLVRQCAATGDVLGARPGTAMLVGFLPFALGGPALGVTVVIPRMDFRRPGRACRDNLLRAVTATNATCLLGSPALMTVLAGDGREEAALAGVRSVATFGAPLEYGLLDRLTATLSDEAVIRSVYGATESLPVSVVDGADLRAARATSEGGGGRCVGRPVPSVRVEIIPADAGPIAHWSEVEPLSAHAIGEITVRGPSVSRTYYGRPHADTQAKIPDGGHVWHRTGDLGHTDDQGNLWYCGRKIHAVPTTDGPLHTECVEPACNTVAGVRRTALVDAGYDRHTLPTLCVETDGPRRGAERSRIVTDLRRTLATLERGAQVRAIVFHPTGFPVDIRHNSKIERSMLGQWARRRLAREAMAAEGPMTAENPEIPEDPA
ncbi:fatty acid CoA ligase family protein [Streptomyces europaeiscabiei]|uniref:Fatty acid CoA ligase family protein n=1 Tax=Streptomyces europaeiscabiei TaxID=146819 RepID=A0AAJ2PPK7_9ACTN|nr:fatty acid CoA ligase family protein [Streptomyces europaeiscabiei]MDX3131224.1 fatty acid CoA ligase family protein [Streptomyces europaeiscabiei]